MPIRINGTTITQTGGGRTVVIQNSRVIVDGQDVTPKGDEKVINVAIEGNVESLKVDVCNSIEIKGSVGMVATQAGDVECGDVGGSVQTMSGDVRCGAVAGNVTTMSGDIRKG